MLAIVLRVFLLLELSLYVSIALRGFSATPVGAAVFAVLCLIGLRALLTGITFAFAWSYRSTALRLRVGQFVGMFLGECAAFILNFVIISPFERWWMGADRLPARQGRPPLLLIHGYGCSRASWWWHRRWLEAAGWVVATINLEPIYSSIDNYVPAVEKRVAEVLAATGAAKLVLVGHSMGGLVARAWLRRHGSNRVAKLVTLGTPHAGSELAIIGWGENARQMRTGSPWLAAFAKEAIGVETLAIYSPHDNFVMHRQALELAGARLESIDALGHLAMLYSPRVARELQAGLANLNRASQKSSQI